MKRVSSAVAIAVVAFVVSSGGATAKAPSVEPSLRQVKATALVLGAHFKPHELVGVTLRSGKTKLVRSVHATNGGKFTVDFPALQQVKCIGTISLVAIGAKGDRATFTITSSSCTSGSGSVSPAVTTPTSGGTTTTSGVAPPPPYVT
jgi:hypothetical protein